MIQGPQSSSGDAGFYSNVFVVPKHTGGLHPILNLKQLNHYIYIPKFKVPTIRHVQQLIQCADYVFSIDVKDAYLHIPFVKHHCCFSPMAARVFTVFTKSFSFADTRVSILLSI